MNSEDHAETGWSLRNPEEIQRISSKFGEFLGIAKEFDLFRRTRIFLKILNEGCVITDNFVESYEFWEIQANPKFFKNPEYNCCLSEKSREQPKISEELLHNSEESWKF